MSNFGIGESRAHLLSERLAAVVEEHYAQEVQHKNQEMENLRREVLRLRGDVTRLQQGFGMETIVDMDKGWLSEATDDVLQGSRSPCKDSALVCLSMNGDAVAGDIDSAAAQTNPLEAEEMETDMKVRFDTIAQNEPYIELHVLENHLTQNIRDNETARKKEMQRYRAAVHKLQRKLSYPLSTKEETVATGHINFASFEFLMTQDPETVTDMVGADVADSLADLRSALIDEAIVNQIAKTCHVKQTEVEALPGGVDHKTRIVTFVEPVSAAMTLLNSLVIGFSLDWEPEWDGWFAMETFFTIFFLSEICINVYARGCTDFLFGEAWYWSWFDIIIVCFAIIDTSVAFLEKLGAASRGVGFEMQLTRLFRLLKITRITRVLRLLRLKSFKELSIMVNGVVSSLRTIFWAVVVLTVCVYMIGVFMRQIVDPERPLECEGKSADTSGQCSGSEEKMIRFGPIMFGSVPRSMTALFLCFTDGCSSPDGTPFIWLLWETHGPLMVLFYLASFVFISFGVFNLIMAMVVENTIATAVQQDAERLFGQHTSNVKKAQQLHALLTKYVKAAPGESFKAARRRGLRNVFHNYSTTGKNHANHSAMAGGDALHLEITHDQFEEMMQDSSVIELLEDLNISYISRKQLFDILDADASGFLSVSEVVDGIMRLRGPADKGDIVGICLSVRQMQTQMSALEHQIKKSSGHAKSHLAP